MTLDRLLFDDVEVERLAKIAEEADTTARQVKTRKKSRRRRKKKRPMLRPVEKDALTVLEDHGFFQMQHNEDLDPRVRVGRIGQMGRASYQTDADVYEFLEDWMEENGVIRDSGLDSRTALRNWRSDYANGRFHTHLLASLTYMPFLFATQD